MPVQIYRAKNIRKTSDGWPNGPEARLRSTLGQCQIAVRLDYSRSARLVFRHGGKLARRHNLVETRVKLRRLERICDYCLISLGSRKDGGGMEYPQ